MFGFAHIIQAQTNQIFATKPAISPDGNQIAFSYQGDIWVIPTSGGVARRLTIHQGYESNPVWSNDGKTIAFNGSRAGNNDIFTVSVTGGTPKRLTYHTTDDQISHWTNQNQLLFTSHTRAYRQIEREQEIHTINANGGTPYRLTDALGYTPTQSPNGKLIAFTRGSCRISREAYVGPANKNVWIYNTQTKKYTQLTNHASNEFQPVWSNDQTLYYIGGASGRYNIYRQKVNADGTANGKATQLTKFTDDGVRYIGVSDNNKLVFERQVSLFTMNADGGSPQKLRIEASSDHRFDPTEYRTFHNGISEYAVSPNGKYAALVIRGEVFIKPATKEKRRAVNISKNPFRDQHTTWLNDSTVIFISDRDGQYDLYLARSADKKQGSLYQTIKTEVVRLTNTKVDEYRPLVSPNHKKIAYRRGRGELVVANINAKGKLSNKQVLAKGWSTPENISWSPDSRWLAYALNDLYFNQEVYIQAADNSKPRVNVSMHPRSDYNPVWSPDGSKLAFLSNRINNYDIWFVWLKQDDWEKSRRDREEGNYYAADTRFAKKKRRKKQEPINIDFENIHNRIVRTTSMPGDEDYIAIGQKGETFYFAANNPTTRGNDLYKAKWDGTKIKMLTQKGKNPLGAELAAQGNKLYFVSRGRLQQVATKSLRITRLPHQAKMIINNPKEREQMFEEGWRALQAGFYDPNFHGQDFAALKKKYKPWALAASTSQDFRELYNLMLGQINASHMGMYGSNPETTKNQFTGLLGTEVVPVNGGVKVKHVIGNTPASKIRSKIRDGEIITAVNGQDISSTTNFYSLLINAHNERIMLTVKGKNGSREVIIRPIKNLSDYLYEEWIRDKKALVKKYSNGRLGYIHIRGMNMPSFERFERELMASGYGKEGIVIDVRFNGGGWTTDYLMTVLNVRQHAYTIPRGAVKNLKKENKKYRDYYPFSERLPLSSWTKPSIALCNQNSYSNAEIFAHAYKHLGVGKLVGIPTFGAVISTSARRLIDGSRVRMPYRAWYVKTTGENMELGPAVPDVMVTNEPDNRAKNQDAQLKKSVEILLKQIGDKKDGGQKK